MVTSEAARGNPGGWDISQRYLDHKSATYAIFVHQCLPNVMQYGGKSVLRYIKRGNNEL